MTAGFTAILVGALPLMGAMIDRLLNKRKGRAETKKLSVESTKTEADTLKSLADVYKIKVGAEIEIAKEWQKILQEIRQELETERAECDSKLLHMQKKLDKMHEEIKLLKNQNKQP
jgi:hypothetical protein